MRDLHEIVRDNRQAAAQGFNLGGIGSPKIRVVAVDTGTVLADNITVAEAAPYRRLIETGQAKIESIMEE